MADVTAAMVIAKMKTMMDGNWKYLFGAELGAPPNDPAKKRVDCSEATEAAVRWAAESVGSSLRLTDGSFAQHDACYTKGTLVPLAQARETPGALVFLSKAANVTPGMGRSGIYHVGLVLNKDTVLEACCNNGNIVKPCSWGQRAWYAKGGRIPGVVYPATPVPPPATTAPPSSSTVTLQVEGGGTVALRVLKKGVSNGRDVREVQVMLNDWGMGAGTPDGVFGSNTDSAVRKFQSARGLGVDGIVGSTTYSSLLGR